MERVGIALPRREFLRDSAVAVGAVLLCSGPLASCRRAERRGGFRDDYYTSRKTELMEGFDELREHTRQVVTASYGAELSDAIDADARREFESLIPEIPYVGGDGNHLTD